MEVGWRAGWCSGHLHLHLVLAMLPWFRKLPVNLMARCLSGSSLKFATELARRADGLLYACTCISVYAGMVCVGAGECVWFGVEENKPGKREREKNNKKEKKKIKKGQIKKEMAIWGAGAVGSQDRRGWPRQEGRGWAPAMAVNLQQGRLQSLDRIASRALRQTRNRKY